MVRVSVLVSPVRCLSMHAEMLIVGFVSCQNDCLVSRLYFTNSFIAYLCFAQNNIVNAERRGKRQVLIRPSSKVIVKFLSVMQRHGEWHPLALSLLARRLLSSER